MTVDVPAPDDAQVSAFWEVAKRRARFRSLPGYFGPTVLESLQPPAWSLGATPEEADEVLRRVLDGSKTATTSLLSDYEGAGEALPEPGTLGIALDGTGRARALLLTTDVRVVPFGSLDPADADDAPAVDPVTPVVLERFAVLYGD